MFDVINVIVTPFQQNCRVVGDPASKSAIVIDPGGDADLIEEALNRRSWTCEQIWLTHSHLDHCGGVAALKRRFEAPLVANPLEKALRENLLGIAKMYGFPPDMMENCPEPEIEIVGQEELQFQGYTFKVLFTPGHSPGHVCFYHQESNTIFAGDTLFAGSIGRSDLPGGDHQTLINSIRDEILCLPDDTKVLPGHGPNTTVGVEREGNPFIIGL